MSDTDGFPLVGGAAQHPGKNNFLWGSFGGNTFGWENLNAGQHSFLTGYRNRITARGCVAFGTANIVSAAYSFASGSQNNVSGTNAFAFGLQNTVSGNTAGAVGSTNTVGGPSAFASGVGNTSNGSYAFAAGQSNSVSGSYSAVFGYLNVVSANASFAAGQQNTASGTGSTVFGLHGLASRFGELAHSTFKTANSGEYQHGWFILGNQSTSATPINLYLDGTTATQNAVLGTGARWKCTAEIIATTTGAINKSASWEYKFQIDRPTNAASTIIRTTPLLSLSDGSNAGAPPAGWAVAITANTTNGCPQIQVTGDTDTINWTCAIHYIQSIRV